MEYPSDRQNLAPQLFLGAYNGIPSTETLIGYVCATRSSADTLTHESMSHHESNGSSVCIHSVCVDTSHRRKGVATRMLDKYAERLSKDPSIHQLSLIAHEELVPLYEKAGFEYKGKSPVSHGSRPWFELHRILQGNNSTHLSSALLAELSKPPTSKPTIEFAELDPSTLMSGDSSNLYDLLCPRPKCGSVILKQGVGKFHLKPAEVDVCQNPCH